MPASLQEWQRQARASQERAERQRREEQRSPHPWPEPGHRLASLGAAFLLVAVGYGLLIAACLLAGIDPPA